MIKATLKDYMGSDLTVVNAARVSFKKESDWEYYLNPDTGYYYTDLSEGDKKLITYLAKHEHYSPFGHCFASFHIKAPIFVARQLVKHEYLRMNEVSRRYVTDEPEFYNPPVWRGKPKDKKQGSSGVTTYHSDLTWRAYCMQEYKFRLHAGVAPEQARTCLPLDMMTEWYWSGSLDAFANMCKLRLKEDTQYETRLVAQQISKELKEIFPYSWSALVGLP